MNLNLTTEIALLSWPLVVVWLYSTRPVGQATLWTILGAYLLLPVNAYFKIPMIPQFDKNSIPALDAFFACMFVTGRPIRLGRGFGLVELLTLTFLFSPFVSAALNSDVIITGRGVIPGSSYYDGGSAIISQFVFLLPFFLGRQILRGSSDTENILRSLVVAGLAYSLPILFELRMSPTLHIWVYGYLPETFYQQARDGGWRPVVFLGHGLTVAFFAMSAVVAAAALWRTRSPIGRLPVGGMTAYLGAILVLCKTAAATLYGIILVPVVRWTSPRMQLRVAVALVTVTLCYPALRTMDLVPTTFLLQAAQTVSVDRAVSLETRFINERRLLARASERFWFGWGRFGRSRVYSDAGNDISNTDGEWVIAMGEFGFIGFLAEFGLLALPVFRMASALRLAESRKDSIYLGALALIVAINVFNQLPNSSLSPFSWLLTGALLGRAEALRESAKRAVVRDPSLATIDRSPLPVG